MKTVDFKNIIFNTPIYMPKFKVIKIPVWINLKLDIKIGDYYLYDYCNGIMIPEDHLNSHKIYPYPIMFKFISYVKVKQTSKGGFKVIN